MQIPICFNWPWKQACYFFKTCYQLPQMLEPKSMFSWNKSSRTTINKIRISLKWNHCVAGYFYSFTGLPHRTTHTLPHAQGRANLEMPSHSHHTVQMATHGSQGIGATGSISAQQQPEPDWWPVNQQRIRDAKEMQHLKSAALINICSYGAYICS